MRSLVFHSTMTETLRAFITMEPRSAADISPWKKSTKLNRNRERVVMMLMVIIIVEEVVVIAEDVLSSSCALRDHPSLTRACAETPYCTFTRRARIKSRGCGVGIAQMGVRCVTRHSVISQPMAHVIAIVMDQT